MLWLSLTLAKAGCFTEAVAPSEVIEDPCAGVNVRATGRAQLSVSGADLPVMVLPDTRLEAVIRSPGDVTARVAWIAVQSGGSAGYIGVAGEAWLPAFQLAEARWDWDGPRLAVAGGLVDDLWGGYAQARWGAPALNTTMALDTGLVVRSDLGGWLGWEVGPVTLTVSSTSGEGALVRERNPGTTTSALARIQLAEETVTVVAYVREGSVGLLRAPDHRVGGATYVALDRVNAGLEALGGWGLAGDGTLRPFGGSLWARTTAALPVAAFARVDQFWSQVGVAETGSTRVWLAGGPWLPWEEGRPRGGMWISGVSAQQFAAGAGPTAGRSASDFRVFTQLSVQLSHSNQMGVSP